MTFVDIASIHVQGGHGGSGCRSFRREKFVPLGGPDGGNGGNGGSVILKATHNLQSLMDIKLKRFYKAKPGHRGSPKNCTGACGDDLVLHVPCGTIISNEHKDILIDLCLPGQTFIVSQGGKGGLGNKAFATSRNKAPQTCQPGLPAEKNLIHLELRMIAEVGLVGLPNAGKSTLLKTLTHANPKISDYPFTTLSPNLGKIKTLDQEILIADIPGLIEGASDGAGLGHDFLRHISRTRFLIHLIESLPDASSCLRNYHIICKELRKSPYALPDHRQLVVMSKIDLISPDELDHIITIFKQNNIDVLPLSSYNRKGVELLIQTILKLYQS